MSPFHKVVLGIVMACFVSSALIVLLGLLFPKSGGQIRKDIKDEGF